MPPTDASADPGTAAPTPDIGADPGPGDGDRDTAPTTGEGTGATGTGPGACADVEDTLDLRLPDELLALPVKDETDTNEDENGAQRRTQCTAQSVSPPATEPATSPMTGGTTVAPGPEDLLDRVSDWGSTDTPAGLLHLVPVHVERDLPLISRWMNDPAVAAFWELSGPQSVTEDHVRAQLAGDGRSVPCIGVLDGTPMSYWEIYRADLDPLARHYPARPHDTGIHLLIGAVADRGRGLGGTLLRAVADLVLDQRPACARVVAEPDLRNIPSIAAFLSAGFRFFAEVDLPAKRAALMVRDRSLRHLL